VTDVRGDDEHAWIGPVVERYERPLMSYAAHLLDADRAGDVVQETFCRLCRSPRAKVEPLIPQWLYRVCRNLAMDIRRKERRMRPSPDQPTLAHPGPGPDAMTEQRDEAARLAHALTRLTDRQQELLRLKFQQALSYKQIAQTTGLSVSNVGFILHTAIAQLKNQLAPSQERAQ
jgi:RNA polymerase sigma-70 factor (ECF subfamily)